MTAFVKSVEYVEITLTDAGPTSVNLTKSQTIADCAPFFTVNLTSVINDIIDRRYVEVFFESGPKVTAQRVGTTGTAIVGVFVVEFDTSGDISVQQGTWDLLTSETNTPETITSVTTTKAFCIINYRHGSTADDWNEAQVKVKFNSGTELDFNRRATVGAVTGRYYVVATAGTDFSVQHITMSPAANAETDTDTITSVTLANTFVYNTFDTDEISDDIRDAGWVVDLESDVLVRARRAFNSFGSPGAASAAATIEAQIVSAGGTEFSAERNECDWGDSLTNTVTITEIDQTKAIVVSGGYQGVMSSAETGGAEVDGNYAILDFNSDTELIGTRAANTDPDGTTAFEVVEFVLSGAVAPSGTGVPELEALTITCVGEQPHEATGVPTLDIMQLAASGAMQPSGIGTPTLEAMDVAAVGVQKFLGTGVPTMEAMSLAAVGVQKFLGIGALEIEIEEITSIGVMQPAGTGAPTLEPEELVAIGEQPHEGTGAPEIQIEELVAVGQLPIEGVGALVMQIFELVAAGVQTGVAAVGVYLPMFRRRKR